MPLVKKTLTLITTIYWILLVYILAALVWWFISLEKQNNEMMDLRLKLIPQGTSQTDSLTRQAYEMNNRKHAQYIGEGGIFMLLIVVGAVFVYRATRRQWKLSQQQQNFMMAVTHELKTPVSIVRLNLETLNRHRLDAALQEKIIHKTLHETDRLNDLCNNILLASRLEGGNYQLHKQPLLLNEIAAQSVQQFSGRFPERMIVPELTQMVQMSGDPVLIKMLVNNLVENALKYAPKDKAVHVSVTENKEGKCITVSDLGPGIPEAEKQLIFEKFYRMGDERTRSSKGTGLGLYLCKKIAHDHHGKITVSDNQPQGSVFKVVFK